MTALVLLAPLIVLMGLFVFYPLLKTVELTFFDYSFRLNTSKFIGIHNYTRWATDRDTWASAWVSVKFFLYYVPANIVLGLAIAILIDRVANKWAAGAYRTIMYFPVVLPAAIVFEMWVWLYDPSFGLFAVAAKGAGADHGLNWLGSPTWALPGLAIMSVWRLIGETVVLFLVGLANIPAELQDAARTDGATEWQVVRRITLPLLTPMLFLVLVLRLKVLGLIMEPLFMTQGGPVDSTMTYGLKAFFIFNRDDQLGYASTWFVMLALVSIAIAVVAGRRMRAQAALG